MSSETLPLGTGARVDTAMVLKPRGSRKRPGPALIGGAAILISVVVLGTWATLFPTHNPLTTVATPMQGPSWANILGTDNMGRDSFVRLALAGLTSLWISGCAALLAATIGTVLGVIAGYLGGAVDAVIMRIVDALLALPAILVALVVGVILSSGTSTLILALGLIFAPTFARVMRAPIIALRERDFVTAAQISGVRTWRIAATHLLPNALTPLFVQFAAVASNVVLLEAALSYLGQGVQAPEPSAGRMISEFQRFMQGEPLLIIAPALLIILLSAGWNLLADGIQDFVSPRRDRALPGATRTRSKIVRRSTTTAPQTKEKRA